MEEHTFVTVNGLRVKIKMSYHINYLFQYLGRLYTTIQYFNTRISIIFH